MDKYNVYINGKAGFNPNQSRNPDGTWGNEYSIDDVFNKLDKITYSDFETIEDIDKSKYYETKIGNTKIKIRLSNHLPNLLKVDNEFNKNNEYYNGIDYFFNFSKEISGGQASSLREVFDYENDNDSIFYHYDLDSFYTFDRDEILLNMASIIKKELKRRNNG